jgi:hypothetical protein
MRSPPDLAQKMPRQYLNPNKGEVMSDTPNTNNKVIIMHGFSYEEIDLIMRAVKKQLEYPKDLIFAKTTKNSLKMKVKDLIEDLSEDHEYLQNNPPDFAAAKQADSAEK